MKKSKKTSSSLYYDSRKSLERDTYFSKYKNNDGTTKLLIDKITNFADSLPVKSVILDIGTGNGFLVREVRKNMKNNDHNYIGVDLSIDMLETAHKMGGNISYMVADNMELPFKDGSIDLLMAKAVTNISAKEIYRILKPGGRFYYKEYRAYKGLKSLPKDINSLYKPDYSYRKLLDSITEQFEYSNITYFNKKITYGIDQLADIFTTMRFMPSVGIDVMRQELSLSAGATGKLTVVSDTFILEAIKGE